MDFNESLRILVTGRVVGFTVLCFYSMYFAVCLATSVEYCQCWHRLSVGLCPGRKKKKRKKAECL